MNRKIIFLRLLAFLIGGAAFNSSAQGTAFFYQGRLNDGGSPANAIYDLRFAIYDASTNGNAISYPITNLATVVSSGLFTATLDFGPIFSGTNYWLAIGVRTNGSTSAFTILSPRQPLLPVPYAIFATSASNLLGTLSTTQLVGTLPSALLTGTYSGAVNFTNAANGFSGSFFGNGILLTNLNASLLATGTVADARLSTNVSLLNQSQTNGGANLFTGSNVFSGGNTFTGSNSFTGANTFSGPLFGNGTNLTSLNASQLTGGTVADARLSTNVALLNGNQTFTGANGFTGGNTFNGVNTFTNDGNYFQGSFFGNGLVGWLAVAGTATNAMRDAGYLLLNAGLTTVTLPATASLLTGDIVRVSGGGAGGWLVKENSGQSIKGNFAAFTNAFLTTLPPANDYHGVAGSADGVRLYAVANGLTGVYASSDYGQTWNQVSSTGGTGLSGYYYSVACSANGKIVYAEPFAGGAIQKSTNSGVDWTATGISATKVPIACTADGGTLLTSVACSGNGTNLARASGGVVQTSSNGGSSWTTVAVAPAANVTSVAASSDCTKLVAAVSNGLLYASSNLGASWITLTATNQTWSGAWMSPDGSKFAATVSIPSGPTGSIDYCNVSALPNTTSTTSTGSIGGSQGAAVELQYLGNGQFMPVSSTGLLWAN